MRDHTKLRAFEVADELTLAVYQRTVAFPREEQFGLTSQMRREAVSIGSNIVEGCARESQADYLRFLDIAYASARELQYQISIAQRLNYLNPAHAEELERLAIESTKPLNGLFRALRNH
jgi:four helix bundle protein